MFFWLSKVLWIFVNPGNFLLLALLVSTALLFTRWRRAARALITASMGITLVLSILPVGGWMIANLENRFPPPNFADGSIDGIVSLGGVVDSALTQERGVLVVGGGYERLTELGRLAKNNPNAKLIFSGGSGSLSTQKVKEADVLAPYLGQFGLSLDRLILENRSRNTHENAVFSLEIAKPQPGERWIVITSAFHMPRTIGTFRQAGWRDITAYPVNYYFGPSGPIWPQFNLINGLGKLDTAIHEWLGLLAYRLSGRSNALFPGPDWQAPPQ